jgi:hypothetical protein
MAHAAHCLRHAGNEKPTHCVGFFMYVHVTTKRSYGVNGRGQISIFVPSSTTRFAGMLKKSVGFAAF